MAESAGVNCISDYIIAKNRRANQIHFGNAGYRHIDYNMILKSLCVDRVTLAPKTASFKEEKP